MSGADAKALEEEKQKNLSGTQKSAHPETAPGWNETLAVSSSFPAFLLDYRHVMEHPGQTAHILTLHFPQSESEAVIKAEHSENEPIEKLQEETIKHVNHKE
jgi:hypothetical protein